MLGFLISLILASGRCVTLADKADDLVQSPVRIAPGAPPLLSFRYYEGKLHRRYDHSDLMLDDAGH